MLVRLLVYALIFYIVYLVVRTFLRVRNAYKNPLDKGEKESRYRDIEEADYKEIRDDKDKKADQE